MLKFPKPEVFWSKLLIVQTSLILHFKQGILHKDNGRWHRNTSLFSELWMSQRNIELWNIELHVTHDHQKWNLSRTVYWKRGLDTIL